MPPQAFGGHVGVHESQGVSTVHRPYSAQRIEFFAQKIFTSRRLPHLNQGNRPAKLVLIAGVKFADWT
jgi:hypothetical protein